MARYGTTISWYKRFRFIEMSNCAQQSVHPTGGSLRVFRQFVWLEVVSVKVALSRPAHQRVTQAVGLLKLKESDRT
jgi:hypothetical protein